MPLSHENPLPAVKTVLRVTVDASAQKAGPVADSPSAGGAASPASGAKVTREAAGDSEPEISVWHHRRLWLAPLMAEGVLCTGATWLSLSLESVIWAPDHGFPVLTFVVLALIHAGLTGYSHLQELFLPRSVVFVGVGSLALAAAGVGIYLVIEGYLVGGLYRLRYVPFVLVPLGLFLARCYFVFRAARAAPALSRLNVNARIEGKGMRVLRARLRYWLRG